MIVLADGRRAIIEVRDGQRLHMTLVFDKEASFEAGPSAMKVPLEVSFGRDFPATVGAAPVDLVESEPVASGEGKHPASDLGHTWLKSTESIVHGFFAAQRR